MILAKSGYKRHGSTDDDTLHMQEVWSLTSPDGSRHDIDVHWQAMNALTLEDSLSLADCLANPRPLPRLAPGALAPDHAVMLIHTAMHRATHTVTPYLVDGVTYYGGDRLIWAYDIDLLASAASDADWNRLTDLARDRGISAVCLEALEFARAQLGTTVPPAVLAALDAAPSGKATTYLLHSKQLARAGKDLLAVRGARRKLAYIAQRTIPSRTFMRAKYPSMTHYPLLLLYLKRFAELIRDRTQGGRY